MNDVIKFCEVCKAETKRCQYYPKGRSRQHDMCLKCDKEDRRHTQDAPSSDSRYCIECDRAHRFVGSSL